MTAISSPPTNVAESTYKFERGYPTAETVKQAYDDGDLNRAIQAYRFFYPPISMAGFLRGFKTQGTQDNKTFAILEGKPNQVLLTPNSDTPYAVVPLDLHGGPITVEFSCFRLYAPTQAYFDRTWILPDFEKVK